mmetsp:Transcript_5917/g.9860  ORF Transcript_5917/g.9860 Transcript_5917/m.9860 type:complete len:200 (-) Transcript_5917:3239-3838(-)
MRVRQFGLEVELELCIVVNLVACDLERHASILPLDDRTRQHWLQNSIDLTANSLDQQLASQLNAEDDLLEPLAHGELYDDQVFADALLYPPETLLLRVNHQRPPRAACQDACVLNGDPVRRQPFVQPACYVGITGKDSEWINLLSHRNLPLDKILGPRISPKFQAQMRGERRDVAHESRRKQAVPDELYTQVLQISNSC